MISRRKVLAWMAAGGGTAVVATQTGAVRLGPLGRTATTPPPPIAPPASILVARADDGLFLSLSFVNLDIQPRVRQTPQLKLRDATQDGFIAVTLPPQSIFEQTVPGPGDVAPTSPLPALLSGPSRVVLKVPKGTAAFDYDLPTILNLVAFPLSTSARANVSMSTQPGPADEPGPNETAIEAPFRLFLSPPDTARFHAARTPVKRNNRTELWHARGVVIGGLQDGPLPVRAIWSKDIAALLTTPAWAAAEATASILPDQRVKLVRATTTDVGDEKAAPVDAKLLLVSPMGASLDLTGKWPDRNDVVAWRHRSWLGRDNYVKIEEPGFLFPFGFPAVKISISERVINGNVAYLRKLQFVVVRNPVVTYDAEGPSAAPGLSFDGRLFPFSKVTTTTLVSPPLAQGEAAGPHRDLASGRWVRYANAGVVQDLRFQLELESHEGRVVHADLPMAFILAGATTAEQGFTNPAYSEADMGAVRDAYDLITDAYPDDIDIHRRRTLHLGGQTVGFIPRLTPEAEDPALPTFGLVVSSVVGTAGAAAMYTARRMNAYPTMVDARVHMETLEGLVPDPTATINLHTDYINKGLPKEGELLAAAPGDVNLGEVWANIPAPPKLDMPQQTGGGLAAPKFDVEGLSRAHGPVASPDEIAQGLFDPKKYFELPDITLLGAVPLNKLVKAITDAVPDPRGPAGEGVPKVVTTKSADAVDTLVSWSPVMDKVEAGLFTFVPSTDPEHERLHLRASFHTDLATAATTSKVSGDLRDSTLDFLGAIELPLTRVRFESNNGAKPSLDLQLGKPAFKGDLRFLTELQNHLPSLPGGVKVDVSTRGITAGLLISLPSVPLGAVLVQNLAIGIELDIPFDGEQATITFSFCTREHPFHCTVMALGGGGFLAIGMGMRGIQKIEGALEFGAAVALDFGVASGSLSIMAGIYIKYTQRLTSTGENDGPAGNTVVITGYVRALGELEVLGLIHASVEFYLGLTFTKTEGQEGIVSGEATLTVRVEVLMFSESVSITVRKEIGSGVDPSFGEQISAGDWNDYCAAFAA
jgi:hypothetical protein